MTAQPDERLAQSIAGGGQFGVRPENTGCFFASVAAMWVKRQKSKQRGCLLGRETINDPVTTTGAQDAKQVNAPEA
jgi:hypothetical protein